MTFALPYYNLCLIGIIYLHKCSVVFDKLNYQSTYMVLSQLQPLLPTTATSSTSNAPAVNLASILSDPAALSSLQSALCPESIARTEQILLCAPYGEELFQTWSALRTSPYVLYGALGRYTSYGGNGEVSDLTVPNAPVDNAFLVVLDMRLVSRPLIFTRQWDASSELRVIDGKTYLCRPQILLNVSANSTDIFRALVVVNRVMASLRQHSLPSRALLSPLRIPALTSPTPPTTLQPPISSTGKADASELDSFILARLDDGYTYEAVNREVILGILKAVGWDTSRFSYGDIKKRVSWGTTPASG